jgi:DNA polymerase-3 subunit delta
MSSSSSSKGKGAAPAAPVGVILLVAAEASLRQRAREEIRAQVLAGAAPAFDEDRFDLAAAGTDPGRILAAARTLPVLAPRRLILVRGLEDRRAQRFLEELLPEYLESPVPSTCLLLEAERIDRRQRWVKRVAEVGQLRALEAPRRPAELRDWITEQLRARGKSAGSGAATALADAIGPDLDRLGSELEKLCSFVGERARVTADDVARITGQTRTLALYELTDAVGDCRRGDALRLLGRLLDQGEFPLALLAALASHLRRLLRASGCRPLNAQTVQERLAVHRFVAERLVKQLQRFDAARLRGALGVLRSADEAIKGALPLPRRSAAEQARMALEQAVLAICG